jgi:hypothetical protein
MAKTLVRTLMTPLGPVYLGLRSAIGTVAQRECCLYLSPMSTTHFSIAFLPVCGLFWKAHGYGTFLMCEEKFADRGTSYIYPPSLRSQSERKPIR